MLTPEANLRLTSVGPGTPMGEVLRRYWHPVATVADLEREEVLPVRLLGEDLALFKTTRGELGLVQERCPHRGISLTYGIPDADGLRCANHGWCFDATGACREQPFEETVHPGSRFKDKVRVTAYPVEALGGLVWAYLGPAEKRPLLPRWEPLVRDGVARSIGLTHLPCNWLQIMEGSMDPVHFEWLHAGLLNHVARKRGEPPAMKAPRHLKVEFERFEFGIYKKRLVEGDDPETSPDWRIGHPVLFPGMVAFKSKHGGTLQIRVPVDDTHTLHVWYGTHGLKDGEAPGAIRQYDLPWEGKDGKDGRIPVDSIAGTDMMAWITQGPIAPRHLERLSAADEGIILFRRILEDAMEAVARGEDPPGLVRDPARNQPMLSYRGEEDEGVGHVAFTIPGRRNVRLSDLAVRR